MRRHGKTSLSDARRESLAIRSSTGFASHSAPPLKACIERRWMNRPIVCYRKSRMRSTFSQSVARKA
eukprot:IDg23809t1